jgi:hypothetical protein
MKYTYKRIDGLYLRSDRQIAVSPSDISEPFNRSTWTDTRCTACFLGNCHTVDAHVANVSRYCQSLHPNWFVLLRSVYQDGAK